MNPARVLVIEDEPKLAELLCVYLEAAGFEARRLGDGLEAAREVRDWSPALVLLDLMLPGKDGLDVCREIRAFSAVPIIMVTARVEEIDRLLGLELGADDYIPKPCNPRELAARLRAVLRRANGDAGAEALSDLQCENVTLRAAARSVSVDGEPVTLTATEFDLLALLMREAGRVVTKERISQTVLGRPLGPYDRSIDVHVSNLRRKLGNAADGQSHITTIHRSGYLFRKLDEH